MSEWMSPETAPLHILVRCLDGGENVFTAKKGEGMNFWYKQNGVHYYDTIINSSFDAPVGWMPLPEPPSDATS